MFWTFVVWLLKGLAAVWVFQLVVFAVGVSLFPKFSKPSGEAVGADHAPEADAIAKMGLEASASKTRDLDTLE